MNIPRNIRQISLLLFLFATLVACSGGDDSGGEGNVGNTDVSSTGKDRTTSTNPLSTVVRTSAITDALCANGGIKVEIGEDSNGDNQLDNVEVNITRNICNGTDGNEALINITNLEIGTLCLQSGVSIESGPDLNVDGTLNSNEITSSNTVCSGSNDDDSTDGEGMLPAMYIVDLTSEPVGDHCANGGTRIDTGPDLNQNAMLDADEITSTAYTCNGLNTVENVPPEVPAETNLATAVNQRVSGTLLATDANNDRLSFSITQEPVHGSLTDFSAITGEFTYTPNDNFEGNDIFVYTADDGRNTSENAIVVVAVEKKPVPTEAFQIDSNALKIIDYPDGSTARTYTLEGVTVDGVVRADLPMPAALSGPNLRALAKQDVNATAPSVAVNLSQLPVSSGTSSIELSLFDGSDSVRVYGERKVTIRYACDWTSDGNSLSISPSQTEKTVITYYTHDAQLAVSVPIDNANFSSFEVRNGNQLVFLVASLFNDPETAGVFESGLFHSGAYFFRVDLSDLLAVDSFGNGIDSLEGSFYVTDQPLPIVSSTRDYLATERHQLIQNSTTLRAFGGTGPLLFQVVENTSPGQVMLDDPTNGSVTYTPVARDFLVDEGFTYKVNDGLLDSNIARHKFLIRDDLAVSPEANLNLLYSLASREAKISWYDRWEQETGFRVEQYDSTCDCWGIAANIPASPNKDLPLQWIDTPPTDSYYRVYVQLPEGDQLIYPGIVVANVDDATQVILDQQSPVSGVVHIMLDNTNAVVESVTHFVDLSRKCVSDYYAWPQFHCAVSTTSLSNGSHLLISHVEYQARSFVEIRSGFTVDNVANPIGSISSRYRVFMQPQSYFPPDGYVEFQIAPRAPEGINTVSFEFDGEIQSLLSRTNTRYGRPLDSTLNCSFDCAYAWRLLRPVAAGKYPYQFTIRSNNGIEKTVDSFLIFPVLIQLNSPADIHISETLLDISGSVGPARNPVSLVVTLGSLTLLETAGPTFSTQFDVTNLAPGNYVLKVVARDFTGVMGSLSRTLIIEP